jgi:acetoin utilization deacetylase AcuC-like enzyme
MVTALVYSDRYLEHDPGRGYPERPERLKAIVEALKRAGQWSSPKVRVLQPTSATRADIELAHELEYIKLIERLSKFEKPLDVDTPVRANTFELALLAAGGTIEAGRAVLAGEVSNAFALIRPPGHHAGRAKGGGFCYFNNLAIAVEWLKREFDLKRVFVLDWDAHHGNGTQDIFYEDPSVLYMSIHQDGRTLYPGTGFVEEIGSGKGEGYNVNVPLPPGSSDPEYLSMMLELFVPLTEAFKPELIAISAGMDAHAADPLTGLQLSTVIYGQLVRFVMQQAEKLCKGRVLLVLEGGYALKALGEATVGVVGALAGEKISLPKVRKKVGVVKKVKQRLAEYWNL